MHARLALAAALVLLATGCGSSVQQRPVSAAASAPLIRWSDGPVPELTVSKAPPAPRCRAPQLRVVGEGLTFQAGPGGAVGGVELRNVGTSACRLTGRPSVRFVGAPRAPAQRQVALPPEQPAFPRLRRPSAWLVSLSPGRSASLELEWRNWCVPQASAARGPLIPPKAARVTLPRGGGSLDVDYNAVTGCDRPGEPSTIGVRPFQAPVLPTAQPWTDGFLTAKVLGLNGEQGPLTARRGEVLRYSVALRNAGRTVVRFDRCPFAAELLAPAGATEAHSLNCAGAHTVAPGKWLRFEMRIRVPADAPTGPNGLFWELDPAGAEQPEAVGRVIVVE